MQIQITKVDMEDLEDNLVIPPSMKSSSQSTQPSQTQITSLQFPSPTHAKQRTLSPVELPRARKIVLHQSKSISYQDEDCDTSEYDIWDDPTKESTIYSGQGQKHQIIPILELMKYRYETSTKQPISCHQIVQLASKLIMRHPCCRLKYNLRKLQWIDFRDWSKS